METNMINLSMVRQSLLSDDSYLEYLDGDYPVDCKCPKCGRAHRVTMFWTGRGVPRKYCPECKSGKDVRLGGFSMPVNAGMVEGEAVRMSA